MKSIIVLRWVLVLPGAIIGSSAIYAMAKLILSITTYDDGVELFGIGKEISFDLYTIGYGLLFGYAYIIIGKTIAPSHGRQVSVALAILPIIYAVLQFGFLVANVFYHFGKPQVTAFLEGPSAAVGAFLSAERQWRLMSVPAGAETGASNADSSTVLGAEDEPIDYDKNEWSEDEDEPSKG